MNLLLVLFGLCLGVSATGQVAGQPTGKLIVVQKVIEQLAGPERTLGYQAVISGLGNQVQKVLADGRVAVVAPPRGQSWQSYQKALVDSSMFASVEPDTYVSPCTTVNDPLYSNQWHLNETSVTRAWDFTLGGGKIVAIVDGGVDLTHPDLMANLVPGYNVLTQTAQVDGGVVTDVRTNGHGTRVAGVAAAVGNNGIGVSGVGPNLRIMPVRVTNDAPNGVAQRSDLLAGAQWAIQHGAASVNVSYTGVENADVEAMGLYARQNGAFLVWAAGNGGNHWDSFDHENVTVVGGLDQAGNRWVSGANSSGYGRGVDIWAPCVQIYTTSKGGGYGNAPAGTSLAVPQVAAALALMKDHLTSLSIDRIEYLLLRRSMDQGTPAYDFTTGWGRLSIGKAVSNPERAYEWFVLPLPVAYTYSVAMSINDNGEIVGRAGTNPNGPYVPFKYSSGTVTMLPTVPGGTSTQATKITNAGEVLVRYYNNGWGGQVLHANGDYEWLADSEFVMDINEAGEVGGTLQGARAARWTTPSSYSFVCDPYVSPSSNIAHIDSLSNIGLLTCWWRQRDGAVGGNTLIRLSTNESVILPSPYMTVGCHRIANSGWMAGYTYNEVNHAIRWRLAAGEALGISRTTIYPEWTHAWDINSDGDTIGQTILNNGTSIDYNLGVGMIHDGLSQNTRLHDILTPPLTQTYTSTTQLRSINIHGEIAGGIVRSNGDVRAALYRPVDAAGAHVSIGNLGESPSYIGSIPPSLNVTFTQPDGVPYPNATVNLGYNSNSGLVSLDRPPSVTGPFRMYLRCSQDVIPGYEGPRFLSRMEPPLSEPAMPIDTSFMPRTGPLINGQPTIMMYPGDVDNSGEIDAADIDVVIANFGSVDGDPNWHPWVDVDGTLEIDAADIDVVIANFGLVDDPEP